MPTGKNPSSFVAIGGVGGSGTRVAAQIVREAGVHIGSLLNQANDNLLFTLMFKRPGWIAKFPSDAEVFAAIDQFTHILANGLAVDQPDTEANRREIRALFAALDAHPRRLGVMPAHYDALLNLAPSPAGQYKALGWKEPNTHVFLPHLAARLANLKYIHVIRNGLDMALSKNQGQYLNWRNQYPEGDYSSDNLLSNRLRFWIAANERAIETGRSLLSDRFLLVRYDDLCANPDAEIQRLFGFLGQSASAEQIATLSNMIQPTTIGRHRTLDARTFREEDRARVADFGFDVTPA